MAPEALQATWFVLVGFFFAVYTILDGFDLGVGVLFPFLGRTKGEKRTLLRALAPVWDGNEVWLIAGAMVIFGAFPAVYATVFSGFYLAIILTVFGLMLRALTFEFRSSEGRLSRLWDYLFMAGSILPPLLLGIALGNVIQGVPIDANGEFMGDFFTLFRPFPLAVGLLGIVVVSMQGLAYTAMKTTGDLQARAKRLHRLSRIAFPAFLALVLVLTYASVPDALGRPLAIIGLAVGIAAWLAMFVPRLVPNEGRAFLLSSATIAALWVVAGAIHYPNMVMASNDPANSLTVSGSSSPEQTLWFMLAVILIGLPLVIVYTLYVYRVFRGKTKVVV